MICFSMKIGKNVLYKNFPIFVVKINLGTLAGNRTRVGAVATPCSTTELQMHPDYGKKNLDK